MRQLSLTVTAVLAIGCGRFGYEELGLSGSSTGVDAGTGQSSGNGGSASVPIVPLPALEPVQILSGNYFAYRAGLAWDGAGYGIAFRSPDTAGIEFLRVDADGNALASPIPVSAGTSGTLPFVTFAGDEYGVAWKFAGAARFQRIGSDGQLRGSTYESTATGVNIDIPIRAAASSTSYVLLFATSIFNSSSLYYTRIDSSTGEVLSESTPLGANAGIDIPIWTGDTWLTVTRNDDGDQVSAQTFLDDWATPIRLDDTADASSGGWILPTASGYGVFWQDTIGIDRILKFQALDASGAPSGQPVEVTTTSDSSTVITMAKRTPRGLEVWLSRRTFVDRHLCDDDGGLIESVTIDEPTDASLFFDAQGAEFTFVYTDVNGLWLERIPSL